MSHTIEISVNELQTIMAALATCAPTGGGSDENVLYHRLAEETDFPITSDLHNNRVSANCQMIVDEYFRSLE